MKRTILVTSAVAALLLSGGAVAVAQETGPNTAACADAKRDVERLEKDLNSAEHNERKREEKKRDDARKARNDARDARDAAHKVVHADGHTATDPEKTALTNAEVALDLRERELNQAQKDLDRETDKVKGIQARLDLAKSGRDKDCDEPAPVDPPTVAPAPPATETVTPPPPVNHGDFSQVGEVPVGVDSGLAA